MSLRTKPEIVQRGYLAKPHERLSSISDISVTPSTPRRRKSLSTPLVDPFKQHYELPLEQLYDEMKEQEEWDEARKKSGRFFNTFERDLYLQKEANKAAKQAAYERSPEAPLPVRLKAAAKDSIKAMPQLYANPIAYALSIHTNPNDSLAKKALINTGKAAIIGTAVAMNPMKAALGLASYAPQVLVPYVEPMLKKLDSGPPTGSLLKQQERSDLMPSKELVVARNELINDFNEGKPFLVSADAIGSFLKKVASYIPPEFLRKPVKQSTSISIKPITPGDDVTITPLTTYEENIDSSSFAPSYIDLLTGVFSWLSKLPQKAWKNVDFGKYILPPETGSPEEKLVSIPKKRRKTDISDDVGDDDETTERVRKVAKAKGVLPEVITFHLERRNVDPSLVDESTMLREVQEDEKQLRNAAIQSQTQDAETFERMTKTKAAQRAARERQLGILQHLYGDEDDFVETTTRKLWVSVMNDKAAIQKVITDPSWRARNTPAQIERYVDDRIRQIARQAGMTLNELDSFTFSGILPDRLEKRLRKLYHPEESE